MLALVLCLGVFAFVSLLGYAILSLLAPDEEGIGRLLLAPVTGVSAAILVIFIVSQLGVPVGRFGLPMAIGLLLASIGVLWCRGKRIPAKDFLPFVLLSLLAVLMVGSPLLHFGFDWVSFCNDDMANYCMGADRLLHYGYYAPPNAATLAGADYTQLTWFLHLQYRPGSELFLAAVSAVTGLRSLQVFMPVIVAFTACQISGAAAMTWAAGRSRLAAWLLWALMAVSALVTLGSLYQLIAQVMGLGIAAGLVAVLLRPLQEVPARERMLQGVLIGLLLAGLLVAYVEILPFFAIGYVLYVLVTVRGDWAAWRRLLPVLAIGAVVVLVLVNRFVPQTTIHLLRQATNVSSEDPSLTMFPYYMVPSGPVYFWGLFAIGRHFPSDALLSTWIAVALLLCAGSAVLVGRSIVRRHGPAFICLVMGGVWAALFVKHSGFGMYKLAMYFQPFILAAVVLGWISLWRNRWVQAIPLLVIAAANVPTQRFYMRMSLGLDQVFSEIPAASSSHVAREYAELLKAHPGSPLELDTYNSTLAKFQMIESIGRPALFPSNDFMPMIDTSNPYAPLVGSASVAAGVAVGRAFLQEYPARKFDMRPRAGTTGPAADGFWLVREGQAGVEAADGPGHPALFVACTGRQSAFNRWYDADEASENFRAGSPGSFADHLIFVASDLGQPYFRPDALHFAIFQLEPDFMFHGRTIAAAGRYLLFRVVNPSSQCRLKLDVTDTFAADGENRLPPADAIGAARVPFPLEGRGSAQVFSAPLTSQFIEGVPFVAIDMGTDGGHIDYERRGLMKLWGRNVPLDRRRIVGFVRDISLVSDEEYQRIDAPAVVQHFPDDLNQRNLEYSGLYEDGFVGDQAFIRLSQPVGATRLVLEGFVPLMDDAQFATDLVLSIDGKEILHQHLPVGEFALAADLPPAATAHNRRNIDLTFSRLEHLPVGDGRPVAVKLTRVGFAGAPSSVIWPLSEPARRTLRYSGIDADGWMARDVSIRLAQAPNASRLVVRAMIPKIDDAQFSTDVVLTVDGREVARKPAGPGEFEIAADLPVVAGDRNIKLSFSKLQRLRAPDTRAVSALLKSIGFERADAGSK